MSVLIFPNTLIELDILNKIIPEKISKIIIYEHPLYFKRFSTFTKTKLLFHRMTTRNYYYYLQKNKIPVTYVEFYKEFPQGIKYAVDPIEHKIRDELNRNNVTIIENPCFVIPRDKLVEFYHKSGKMRFASFYTFSKQFVDIPYANLDRENREPIKKGDEKLIPKPPIYNYPELMRESKTYIEKHFKNNPGEMPESNEWFFPLSTMDAKKHFLNWLKYINPWGLYQDAYSPGSIFVFHSNMSSSLNCGFITPRFIIKHIQKLYKRKDIRDASKEAFLREIQWREMNRYVYENKELLNTVIKDNYFNINNKIDKNWYTINKPVFKTYDYFNHEKDNFLKYGFAHHTVRLMQFGTAMLLLEISPHQGFQWFFSLGVDSYEWVMIYNCYAMNWHSGGTKFFSKPYINSSNYIYRMSGGRIKKNEEFDLLYQRFVKKYKNKLMTRK